MSIILEKNKSVIIMEKTSSAPKFSVGLGWTSPSNDSIDIDASIFALSNKSGAPKLAGSNAVCYYGCKSIPGVQHSGDNTTGVGAGDDETLNIDFSAVDANADELSVFATVYTSGKNFGRVTDAYVRVLQNGNEIARYNLDSDFGSVSALQFGSFVKTDAGWEFKAVGAGFNATLRDISAKY